MLHKYIRYILKFFSKTKVDEHKDIKERHVKIIKVQIKNINIKQIKNE